MAQWCPRVDPLRPPTLPRDTPGALLYGATCMPGTATAAGCHDDQKFWAVVVPWDTVTGPAGWTAPGGNRYWASTAAVGTPTATAILRLQAERSRLHTQNVFKNWDDYKDLRMAQVLAKTQGKLALDYGVVHVELRPDPNETAAAFARRGGYLLWVDPQTGAFASKTPIDGYRPSWLPDDVRTCQLWAYYQPGASVVEYSVRVDYRDTLDQVIRAAAGTIQRGFDKFCATVSGEKIQQAKVAVDMYRDLDAKSKPPTTSTGSASTPAAAAAASSSPYAAAWAIAIAGCARYTAPSSPCEPRPDQPLPPATPLVTTTGGWKAAMTASAGGAALMPGVDVTSAAVTVPAYPAGSLAWYDKTVAGYRIAVPVPGNGTTHAPVTAALKSVPAGVTVVTTREWERATRPFWQRGSTKIGLAAVGGIAVISTATVLLTR